jgi:hypothetical protein
MKKLIKSSAFFVLMFLTFVACTVYKKSNVADNMVMKIIKNTDIDTLFTQNQETGKMEMSIVENSRIDTVYLYKE